jgi:hypothetical protein
MDERRDRIGVLTLPLRTTSNNGSAPCEAEPFRTLHPQRDRVSVDQGRQASSEGGALNR